MGNRKRDYKLFWVCLYFFGEKINTLFYFPLKKYFIKKSLLYFIFDKKNLKIILYFIFV